jgi:hypothetical protein
VVIGRKIRGIGLVVAIGLTLWLRFDPTFRDLGVPVGLIAFGLSALVAEFVGSLHAAVTPKSILPFRRGEGEERTSPVLVRGVEGQANSAKKVERLSTESPRMVGRVVLVSLFIGRDGREWDDEEVARGIEAIERAARWIEHEADRYGVGVQIGLAQTYFQVRDDEDDPVELSFANEAEGVGPMEARASAKAITAMSRAAASLGFADSVDLIGQVGSKIDANSTAWLIHLRE